MYFIIVHIKFGTMSIFFYSGELTLLFFFPMITIGVSAMIKDFIVTLAENRQLVKTVENIIQVLPESVIVENHDQITNESVL